MNCNSHYKRLCHILSMLLHYYMNWLVGVEFSAPIRNNIGHFGGGLHSQSLDWYWQTKQYRKIDKQTQYKSEKVNNLKYSKTKLPWCSCLLQHSARKRGGLILQRSRAHTGHIIWNTLYFIVRSGQSHTVPPCIASFMSYLPQMKQEAVLLQMDHVTRCISQNLARNKLYNKSTTNYSNSVREL